MSKPSKPDPSFDRRAMPGVSSFTPIRSLSLLRSPAFSRSSASVGGPFTHVMDTPTTTAATTSAIQAVSRNRRNPRLANGPAGIPGYASSKTRASLGRGS